MKFETCKMEDALACLIDYRGKTPHKTETGIMTLSARSVRDGYIDYSQCYFISEDELKANHSKLPHGGFVIRSGVTGNGNKEIIEYSLKLDSNPEFSSSALIAYARACYRMNQEGNFGAKTVFDVAPRYLSSLSDEEMRAKLL